MNTVKQITALVLALSLVLATGTAALAADSPDRDEMADFLNELTILRGDGTGYNFDGQLKRSEAATFIVRMLGKDGLVTDNPEDYSTSSFSDVEETDWFAPYVSYCVMAGIVGGFEDGTFRPNDYVSEKAFLKMLMTSMGYEYNEDFSWSEVYSYAYEINLVTDETYETKVNDNYSYTRGEVVSALYDTLSATKKGSDERMIQYFIDEAIIDEDDAVDIGIISDTVETEIEDLIVVDENTIILVFNEPMGTVEADDMIVYEKDDSDRELTIDTIEADEDRLSFTITFEEDQEPDEDYGLMVDRVPDSYGNESDLLSERFEGFRPDVIESDFFRISYAEAISSKTIHLHYTHPVNVNITQSNLYTLTEGSKVLSSPSDSTISISLLGSDDMTVAITLEDDTLDEDDDYKLKVSGLATSQYGVTLNSGDGDTVTFQGIEEDEEPLELETIVTTGTNTIGLTFNRQVNETIAEQIFMYYLTDEDSDPMEITKATVIGIGDEVTLTLDDDLEEEDVYNLMINRINDVSGEYEIIETNYSFTAEFEEVTDVRIEEAESTDSNTIVLTLSRALDETYATKTSYYDVDGVGNTYSSVPIAVYYEPETDPLTLKLFLDEGDGLSKDKVYEVSMSSKMLDAAGREQDVQQEEAFTHETSKNNDVYIKKAVAVGESTLKLTFNKELAQDFINTQNTNYELQYDMDDVSITKVPIYTIYIDPMTIIAHFDQLDEDIDYTVTFDSLIDYSGVETDNADGDYSEDVQWD